jgi:site-specific recombinase XerC
MKDKSYRRYPLGEDVGRFLRALRVERRSLNTRESVVRSFFRWAKKTGRVPFNPRRGNQSPAW